MSTHSERNVSTDSERNAIRSTEDAARLRVTFDEDAERYDRARPGYPPAVFDDLAADVTYTTASYIDVLLTYSGHRALEPSARARIVPARPVRTLRCSGGPPPG